MACPCDKNNCAGGLPARVLEAVKDCGPVLFHKVVRPASLGDDTDAPADTLDYKNVLLVYAANDHAYLYSSDGVPTFISMGDVSTETLEAAIRELQTDLANETVARADADEELQTQITVNTTEISENTARLEQAATDITALEASLTTETAEREQADSNLQNQLNNLSDTTGLQVRELQDAVTTLDQDINDLEDAEVQTDTSLSSDTSTVTIVKTTGSLMGVKTETSLPLPVASETAAGIMNASTYTAVQENAENIDAILNGAVAVEHIRSDVTQAQLTIVWQQNTGKTELINRASIYDITNKKVWTYYENKQEWLDMPAGEVEVTVSQATNESLGIVKGSTENGQVAVEADGTMSLNGYDGLTHDVDNLAELVAGIEVPKVPNRVVNGNATMTFKQGKGNQADHLILEYQAYGTTDGSTTSYAAIIPNATSNAYGAMSPSDKSKLDSLLEIKSLNDSLELDENGQLSVVGGGGASVNLLEYTLSAPNLNQLWYPVTTEDSIVIRGNVIQQSEEDGANVALSTLPAATTLKAGVMTATDKTKLNALGVGSLTNMDGVLQSETEVQIEFARANLTTGASETQTATIEAATSEEAGVMLASDKVKLDAIPALTEMQWTRTGNLPPAVVTGFEDTTYGTDTITMHLDTKDLATGGVSVQELMIEGATANTDTAGGHAGLMTAFQATQLAALAESGGSGVTLLSEYTAEPAATATYDAAYINAQLGNVSTVLETLTTGTGV